MGKGTIVDAPIISAPSSTKNAKQQRDPQMHQTRKGKQWYFGMKVHTGTDADSGIVHTVIGTIRRECLDWMIPILEAHLRSILKEWVTHYNRGRAHSALGPGVPDPPAELVLFPKAESRHRLAAGAVVLAKSILGGLHHEYSIVTARPGS